MQSKTIGILSALIMVAMIPPAIKLPKGDPDNGGLFMPDGFQAVVVVDSLPGKARHLAVRDNGDVFVKGRAEVVGGMNWVLRDTNADGKADIIRNFGSFVNEGAYSTGMRIHNGYLYTSSELLVYRYPLKAGEMIPSAEPEIIVKDNGPRREHNAKPFAFDNKGNIFVPFGAPSDACQEMNRVMSSPGLSPCPLLDSNAGVWMFKADKLDQFRSKDGIKVATGLRSIVGIEWNPQDKTVYAVVHGRDGLNQSWPQFYTDWDNAVLPSEGLYKINKGTNAGWPYYYYDQIKGKIMVNPEYGGDGKKEATDKTISKPLYGFPGHYAPNDLLFYKGNQFPERYKQGVFVAFHGSTIRAPYPQAGYFIGFIPIKNGIPQKMEVFADGFAGVDTIVNTSDAKYRPMGLSEGPDGSLYVSETERGKVWRIMYKGNKNIFGTTQLAKMKLRNNRTNVKNPDPIKDKLDLTKSSLDGVELYKMYCRSCHQRNGLGDGNRFPPLVRSEWVNGDKQKLISILLKGMSGPLIVNGKEYNNVMPAFGFLKDQQVADLLNFIRTNFENKSDSVTVAMVAEEREK